MQRWIFQLILLSVDLTHHKDGKATTSHKCNICESSSLHKQNHMASNEGYAKIHIRQSQIKN